MDPATKEIVNKGILFGTVVIITMFLLYYLVALLSRPRSPTIVYLIYADWCPACENFKPVWKALKNSYGEHMRELNSDNQPALDAFKQQYQVDIVGYPTIMTVQNGEAHKYTGSRDPTSMEKFIREKCCIV